MWNLEFWKLEIKLGNQNFEDWNDWKSGILKVILRKRFVKTCETKKENGHIYIPGMAHQKVFHWFYCHIMIPIQERNNNK